jgi:hypothetical protein
MICTGLLLLAGLAASRAIDEPNNIPTDIKRMKDPEFISIVHDPTHCIQQYGSQLNWGPCESAASFQAPIDPLNPRNLLKTEDGTLCMSIDPDSPFRAVIMRPCQEGKKLRISALRSHLLRSSVQVLALFGSVAHGPGRCLLATVARFCFAASNSSASCSLSSLSLPKKFSKDNYILIQSTPSSESFGISISSVNATFSPQATAGSCGSLCTARAR